MNVINYSTITCNLKKNVRLQITFDYIKKVIDYNRLRLHEKCNRLQLITITNYDYPMSGLNRDKLLFLIDTG